MNDFHVYPNRGTSETDVICDILHRCIISFYQISGEKLEETPVLLYLGIYFFRQCLLFFVKVLYLFRHC